MLFKKEKSMKLSRYFELVKPKYTYIKVVLDKSIRNFFETNFKIAYILDITKEDTSFYFMIPKPFVNIIIEKVREVWPKTTLVEVQEIKEHVNPVTYQLSYKKEDDLCVLYIMQDSNRVTIIYNFIPRTK